MVGKKIQKIFSEGGSPQKIETFFTKMAEVFLFMKSESSHFTPTCGRMSAINQWRRRLKICMVFGDMTISKILVFRKKFIFYPLVFHSVETLRRRAYFKWEQMSASVVRLKRWKPHPSIENGLRWANFFSKGGVSTKIFTFSQKWLGNFYLSIPEVPLHQSYAPMYHGWNAANHSPIGVH